jgi:hypothetical protein
VALLRTEQPASDFAGFVETYFPALKADAAGQDLRVSNSAGDEVFVRRVDRPAHSGLRYIRGTDQFETAAIHSVLGGAEVRKRDAKSLIDMLAVFNNR